MTCSKLYQAVYMCCRKASLDYKAAFTSESPALPITMLLAVASPPQLLVLLRRKTTQSSFQGVKRKAFVRKEETVSGKEGSPIVLHGWIIQFIWDNWASVWSVSSTEKVARQCWIQRWQVDVCDVIRLCVSGSCGCYTALTPAGHSVMQP